MKKAFSFALILLVTVVLCFTGCGEAPDEIVSVAQSESGINQEPETPASDFEYTENSDGGISITKYRGSHTDIIVPQKINEKYVTQIGDSCFYFNSTLTSVVLPDSIILIGGEAFSQCSSLSTVVLSQNLKEIGNGAFSECNKLSEITLPDCLTKIGIGAFLNCTSLKHITIPESVTELGWKSFMSSGLETLTLEEGLEIIPNDAFGGTQLREIVLPSSVTELGSQAFGGCANLENVILNEGLVKIGDRAFGGKSKLTELVIPKSVQDITEHVVSGCNTLEKLKFEGDAPNDYVYPIEEMPIEPVDVHYTIYFHSSAQGFTLPEWNGYPTAIW